MAKGKGMEATGAHQLDVLIAERMLEEAQRKGLNGR